MHLWLELGSYCFSPNSDVGLVENVAENIQGMRQFAKFNMLQIEEDKYVYHIYTFRIRSSIRASVSCRPLTDVSIASSFSSFNKITSSFASRFVDISGVVKELMSPSWFEAGSIHSLEWTTEFAPWKVFKRRRTKT